MRVLFNTYPVAFDCPGGGEVQLLQSRRALENLGVQAPLFDLWRPCLREVDIVHYFSVQGGSMNFCDHVKRIGLPLAISPILWLTPDNERQLPLGEIHDLLHRADLVLPNSLAERDQLCQRFQLDSSRCAIIPNGVDLEFFEPVAADLFRRHFHFERPFLLNVANLEPRKNQLRLIEAARNLDIDLVLLGSARDPAYLHDCLAAGSGWVHHLGHVEHGSPLLRSAYRACETFVLPSLLETPGLAALEAAACGAKVALTEVGSTREYFGSSVSYADPLDVDSIRRAIEEQLAAPRDVVLQQRIRDRFTWAHAGRSLLEAYERTLARAAAA